MNNDELVDKFNVIARERIREFGLPKWVETDCPTCKNRIALEDIMSFEVHFTPIFLGDISFSYMCKKCNSVFIRHAKCDVKHICDLMTIFKEETLKYRIDFRENFLNRNEHNVLFKLIEEEKEKKVEEKPIEKPEEIKNG